MVVVPQATGLRPAEAFDALRVAELQPVLLGVPTIKSNGNTGYRVAAQEPPAGHKVDHGTRVCLALGTTALSFGGTIDGPPVASRGAPAPDVVGAELEEAIAQVTNLGLIAVVFQPERGVVGLEVQRQAPQPGEPTSFREVVLWLD